MKMHGSEFRLPDVTDPRWRIGIVRTLYYEEEVGAMAEAARALLLRAGIEPDVVSEYTVLGAFEIPLVGAALAKAHAVDALIGLGIIVDGETFHAEHLAREVTRGMMNVQLSEGIPFGYEVLHVRSLEDARARGGKGAEAALAVLHSLAQLKRLQH